MKKTIPCPQCRQRVITFLVTAINPELEEPETFEIKVDPIPHLQGTIRPMDTWSGRASLQAPAPFQYRVHTCEGNK